MKKKRKELIRLLKLAHEIQAVLYANDNAFTPAANENIQFAALDLDQAMIKIQNVIDSL